jgi:hypothetical protein
MNTLPVVRLVQCTIFWTIFLVHPAFGTDRFGQFRSHMTSMLWVLEIASPVSVSLISQTLFGATTDIPQLFSPLRATRYDIYLGTTHLLRAPDVERLSEAVACRVWLHYHHALYTRVNRDLCAFKLAAGLNQQERLDWLRRVVPSDQKFETSITRDDWGISTSGSCSETICLALR